MKQKFARKIAFTLSAMTCLGLAVPVFAEESSASIEIIGGVNSVNHEVIGSTKLEKSGTSKTDGIEIKVKGVDADISSISEKSLTNLGNFSTDVETMKSGIKQSKVAGDDSVSSLELLGAFIVDKDGKSKLSTIKEADMAKIAKIIRKGAVKKASETTSSGKGGDVLSKSDETKAIANGWN